jgi:hypothetical protein
MMDILWLNVRYDFQIEREKESKLLGVKHENHPSTQDRLQTSYFVEKCSKFFLIVCQFFSLVILSVFG